MRLAKFWPDYTLRLAPFIFLVCLSWSTGSPLGTAEPLVLLTPPRCLTANRTQHGVLLTWLPPGNHSSPIDRYIMEFRLGERWEVLDDLIPSTETELIARDLVQVRLINITCLCRICWVKSFKRKLAADVVAKFDWLIETDGRRLNWFLFRSYNWQMQK